MESNSIFIFIYSANLNQFPKSITLTISYYQKSANYFPKLVTLVTQREDMNNLKYSIIWKSQGIKHWMDNYQTIYEIASRRREKDLDLKLEHLYHKLFN